MLYDRLMVVDVSELDECVGLCKGQVISLLKPGA